MKNATFLARLHHALRGVLASLNTEQSFRVQVLSFFGVLMVLLVTRPPPIWWALLLLVSGCVLTTELINTALEKLIDHLHPDIHPAIKIVKDTLAGAVLLISISALLVAAVFICFEVTQF